MAVQTAAGSKIYIADPGALSPTPTYVEIGEVTNMGEFGRVYELITHQSLGERGDRKFKGSYNDGQLPLQLGRDVSDSGQEKLIAARDSDSDYQFKVELNDAPSGGSPTTFTFEAKVMSYTTNVGSLNQVVGATATVEIKSGTIAETAAA